MLQKKEHKMTLFGQDAETVIQFFPRPDRYDKNIVHNTLIRWSDKVEQWLRGGDDTFPEGVEIWREEFIKKLIDHDFDLYFRYDPFEIAKYLDRIFGFDADAELVDVCEYLQTIWYNEQDKAIKIWVKDNGIEPHLSVGETAIWNQPNSKVTEGVTKIPIVIKEVMKDNARFVVNKIDKEGNDVPDIIGNSVRVRRSVVPYEQVSRK